MAGPRTLPVDCARWSVSGFLHGFIPWSNELHLRLTSAGVPGPSELSILHSQLVTRFLFFWGGVASHDASWSLSRLEWQASYGLIVDEDLPDAPGSAGDADIAAAAACFTWHTQQSGRGRFCRTFIVGLPQSSYAVSSRLESPPASSWQTLANEFLVNVDTTTTSDFQTCTLIRIERQRNRVVLDPPTVQPIQSVRLSPTVATQVRRLRHARLG